MLIPRNSQNPLPSCLVVYSLIMLWIVMSKIVSFKIRNSLQSERKPIPKWPFSWRFFILFSIQASWEHLSMASSMAYQIFCEQDPQTLLWASHIAHFKKVLFYSCVIRAISSTVPFISKSPPPFMYNIWINERDQSNDLYPFNRYLQVAVAMFPPIDLVDNDICITSWNSGLSYHIPTFPLVKITWRKL